MLIKAVIDRFESDKAVLLLGEEERQAVWLRQHVPAEAQEGDILQIQVEVDAEATQQARAEAELLLQDLLAGGQENG